MNIARRECLQQSHGRNRKQQQQQKIYHNCKAKGGKEKVKRESMSTWQQWLCVLEDKQTKNIVGNKRETGNRRTAQSYFH